MSLSVYAPGRAELLGNHTDYNEGFVLAIAVDRGTTLAGEIRAGSHIHLHSLELKETQEVDLTQPLVAANVAPWSRYILGVVDQFQKAGLPVGGFSAEITSNLPIGAGLSSSASLEIATALFLMEAFGGRADLITLARLAQKAENEFVGVRCGVLDQIASLMGKSGHATHIDCRSYEVTHVPLPETARFVIANSGVKHALVGGEYNERRESCEAAAKVLGVRALRDVPMATLEARRGDLTDLTYRRAKHIVGENERVEAGSRALAQGDAVAFGQLLFASHQSSQDYFENSCAELDQLVAKARVTPGVLGARLSGGGFGGATINLVQAGQEDTAATALAATLPTAKCLVTPAADGAQALLRRG